MDLKQMKERKEILQKSKMYGFGNLVNGEKFANEINHKCAICGSTDLLDRVHDLRVCQRDFKRMHIDIGEGNLLFEDVGIFAKIKTQMKYLNTWNKMCDKLELQGVVLYPIQKQRFIYDVDVIDNCAICRKPQKNCIRIKQAPVCHKCIYTVLGRKRNFEKMWAKGDSLRELKH